MERSRRMIVLVAAALGILVALMALQKPPGAKTPGATSKSGGEKISWLTDLPEALAKAKETDQPIMIDFFATWCGPCKLLDKETYSDDRVAEASKGWLMVRIDVDQKPALAQYYNVSSIPTIVVVAPDGKEVRRETGFIPAGPMLTLMDKGAKP